MTLVELLVAVTATAILIAGVCGIYFSVSNSWERQQGEADALIAASRACSRLTDYISQSYDATVISRFSSGDTLAVNLPADAADTALYVPVWIDGKLAYRSGQWLVFYLSDNTGSYSRSGDILWAATLTWDNYPNSVVPDATWSLYYGQPQGRIAPLRSLSFSSYYAGSSLRIDITASAAYKISGTEKQITITRRTSLRNW